MSHAKLASFSSDWELKAATTSCLKSRPAQSFVLCYVIQTCDSIDMIITRIPKDSIVKGKGVQGVGAHLLTEWAISELERLKRLTAKMRIAQT